MVELVAIGTHANHAAIWAALTDVDQWPQWTKSISSLQRLDDGPLAVGSQVRIKQPRMPALTWTVTELRDQESFVWTARSPGVSTVGSHRIKDGPDGLLEIVLTIEHDGPLAGVVRALTRHRTRRYMEMEAAGLKAASEAERPTQA